MPSEHAFLRQRLALVERWLANPAREFVPAGRGRVRRRTQPSRRHNLTYRREARLLCKLLERTRDGQVLNTLKAWRTQLSEFLREHRRQYKGMQDIDDEIEVLLQRLPRYASIAEASIAVKFYIISWSTLADLLARLIADVFDLGIADKDIRFAMVMRNRHVRNSALPALLEKRRCSLRPDYYLKKRNDIAHRGLLEDPELTRIEWARTAAAARRMLKGEPCALVDADVSSSLQEFLAGKQAEFRKHYDHTLATLDEVMLELAKVFQAKSNAGAL